MAAGKIIMRAHDKVEVFDVYMELKFLAIYEEFSSILVIDLTSDWQFL